MLAEKFFLVLETLRSHASDGSVKVIRTAKNGANAGQCGSRTCVARVANGIG